MSKSNTFENQILALILNATAIADLAENDTTSPATNLYLALHTADPGEAGTATTSEAAYTSYARVAVPRTSSGWTVSGNSATLTSAREFPEATGGTETLTHFSLVTSASGAGTILYKGALSANIAVTTGVRPRLGTGTTITED